MLVFGCARMCVCVVSVSASAQACHDCCITMDVTVDLCVCAENVYVLVLWDKRVKSISLDWMKMLLQIDYYQCQNDIPKKPKSVFKQTAQRGYHSKEPK